MFLQVSQPEWHIINKFDFQFQTMIAGNEESFEVILINLNFETLTKLSTQNFFIVLDCFS